MARSAIALTSTKQEVQELIKLTRGKKTEKRHYERAQIILMALDKKQNKDIAATLKTNVATVAKWRKRFAVNGLDGLKDGVRSGKPKIYDSEYQNKILQTLEQKPPKGQSSWDGESLSKATGASPHFVWRFLNKKGIQLQRIRSWCVSTDKEFSAKSADIIGLYLNPPQNALVLCVDEKPSIQALGRKTGYVETSNKKIVRGMQSTYKRNGTINLFAALKVASGEVQTKTTKAKKRVDFLSFMDDVVKDIPDNQAVHVILDNYSTHKKNDVWLKLHPNVKFHFTPTSASWLNQVEIWFGIMTRKALKGASFDSVVELVKAIEEFTEIYHKNAKPFVWKKREVKGSQLRNTIMNLCS